MGPNATFERIRSRRLTRRVPAIRVVSAVPEGQRQAKRSRPPKEPRTPRIVETLRKAIEWRRQLDAGEVANQASIARIEGITRARVTQVLMLLRLAPTIQEDILGLKERLDMPRLPESILRAIALIEDPEQQLTAFNEATQDKH